MRNELVLLPSFRFIRKKHLQTETEWQYNTILCNCVDISVKSQYRQVMSCLRYINFSLPSTTPTLIPTHIFQYQLFGDPRSIRSQNQFVLITCRKIERVKVFMNRGICKVIQSNGVPKAANIIRSRLVLAIRYIKLITIPSKAD